MSACYCIVTNYLGQKESNEYPRCTDLGAGVGIVVSELASQASGPSLNPNTGRMTFREQCDSWSILTNKYGYQNRLEIVDEGKASRKGTTHSNPYLVA